MTQPENQPVNEPLGPPSGDLSSLQIDFNDISDEAAAIQGQMVGQLTKDLAAQRAITKACQRRLAEMQQQMQAQQEVIQRLETEIRDKANPPIKDLAQAEKVLDGIIEDAAASSNGDKPAAKEVPSPARPTRPPVKETSAK